MCFNICIEKCIFSPNTVNDIAEGWILLEIYASFQHVQCMDSKE